jgi:primosomal protein N' (replication factor Y)
MHLYEIGVSSTKYHGREGLTYASAEPLQLGTVVEVPLRAGSSLGVVLHTGTPNPKFTAKPITTVYATVRLPQAQLDLLQWLRIYYPAPLATIVQLFLPSKVALDTAEPEASTAKDAPTLPSLTPQQQSALKTLTSTTSSTALLHGDTGTGKTRVYLELTRQTLAAAKSVIVLVPEIGLTPQVVQFFEAQFPGQIRSIHSGMTDKQRRETWRIIHDSTTPQVIIGPRSALFMPVSNLGLIVVDEAHDNGYKQDQLPYYEATRVAAKLAALTSSLCIYGTATPRVADYWHLTRNGTPVVRLSEQINQSIKQPVHQLIDSSQRDSFNRSTIFSEPMLEAIAKTMARGEQSLVFLNRRGTARFVTCSDCGWHASCPNCDTPLTYHGDKHQLQCHTCGIKQTVPTICPDCGSAELRYQRRGTKALQTELEKFFPEARIARFDSDNTKDETLVSQYEKLARGDTDIIIGTQIIAKGLDLANLSLVCIPQADLSTYLPDFTADEQTFQLLRQVFGRVGRTDKASSIVVQTYTPNSPIIQAAATNNWAEFYDQQIEHRKKYNFPPYAYLLQLTNIKASPEAAKKSGEKLKIELQKMYTGLEILGPAPRFHEKIQGKYQWQLVIKSKSRQDLLNIINTLPAGWRWNIDPTNLL